MYSHCNSIYSYSTWRTYVHSVHPTRTSICHFITSATSYVPPPSPAQPLSYWSPPIQAVSTSSPAQPLSYSSPPIQAVSTSSPAQPLSYSSPPIQQGHPSSPEQPPCLTPFTSQQPLFTAPTLPATDPNHLLQQTFITNQVLLTVLKNQTTIMNTLNNLHCFKGTVSWQLSFFCVALPITTSKS